MLQSLILMMTKLTCKAILPTRKHSDDAGVDFYAMTDIIIPPHMHKIIHTGIAVKIPEGYCGFLKPKSKHSFFIGGGVIDEGYLGEILFNTVNLSYTEPIIFRMGDAVGQLVLIKTAYPPVFELSPEDFNDRFSSLRGTTGGIHGI